MKLTQAILILLFINGLIASSQFENNGYKNVIVSIHPDVANENGQDIIDNIKVWNSISNYNHHNKIKLCHRQAAVGHCFIVCVKCCRMVDSVPIWHTISIL